jgi:hypothetical protein
MILLNPVLELRPDESLPSFVSRLASLHRLPNAVTFCNELGFRFQGIAYGSVGDVGRLSLLTGVPEATLSDAALIKRDQDWTLNGERLTQPALRRPPVAFCPACLRDDRTANGPDLHHVYGRRLWFIAGIRTCPIHDLSLAVLPKPRYSLDAYDFTCLVEPYCQTLDTLVTAMTARPASSLERYVRRRLDGVGGDGGDFDAMPLYAVIRACETFGAVARHGPARRLDTLTDEEWYEAGGTGYDDLVLGSAGIHKILEGLRASHSAAVRAKGDPGVLYNRLYKWLTYSANDPAYAPLIRITADDILRNTTVGLGTRLFGEPIERRVWHSVRTAAVETGIHPKRLRRLLIAAGHIPPTMAALSDDRVIFPAGAVADLLEEIRIAFTADDIATHLAITKREVNQLIAANVIKPFDEPEPMGRRFPLFRRSDIEALFSTIASAAVPVTESKPHMCDLWTASKRAMCRIDEIFALLASNKLSWVGLKEDTMGLTAILVDFREVRQHTRGTGLEDISLREAKFILKTHQRAIKSLIDLGYLETTLTHSRYNHRAMRAITARSMAEFHRTYVTAMNLARERGMHVGKLIAALKEAGAEPVTTRGNAEIRLYRRKDIDFAGTKPPSDLNAVTVAPGS